MTIGPVLARSIAAVGARSPLGVAAAVALIAAALALLVGAPAWAANRPPATRRAAAPFTPAAPAMWARTRMLGVSPQLAPAVAPASLPRRMTAPRGRAPASAPPVAGPCEAQVARAARRHGVPEGVLYAVGLVETGRRDGLSPYALNIEGQPVFAADAGEALARFAQARAQGKRLIDLGCMQINHHFHGHAFASPQAMLDPAANVDYAARFLTQLRAREGSWTMAVARYHAGPHNDPAQKRYVCAVIAALARAGAGAWTESARAFCGGG